MLQRQAEVSHNFRIRNPSSYSLLPRSGCGVLVPLSKLPVETDILQRLGYFFLGIK